MLVPRAAGPLRPLDARPGKRGDDLDVLIDEVFGPSTDEGPGRFDAGLVLVGLILIAWSWLAGGAGLWVGLGISMVLLGVALPVRSALRLARTRRLVLREQRAVARGLALDVSDPSVGTLAGSYEALVVAAGLPGVTIGAEAISAGHTAVLEVASLLHGGPPLNDEERAYVDRRTAAIRDLTARLSTAYRGWRRRQRHDQANLTAAASERAAAIARAREELEAASGTSAVDDLERLCARLDARDHDDAS